MAGKRTNPWGGLWPVAEREMRAAAHQPLNYWLRVGAGAVVAVVFFNVASDYAGTSAEMGPELFAALHAILLGTICLVAPALAADSIAREKREGTLGLLFLTPLAPAGIVAGKALSLGIRVFSLWLAALPVLTIPFLVGGVERGDALMAFDIELCAAILCLAAGMLASCLAKERIPACLLAWALGVAFVLSWAWLALCGLLCTWPDWISSMLGVPQLLDVKRFLAGSIGFHGYYTDWSVLWKSTRSGPPQILSFALVCPLLSLLILYRVLRFAGWVVARSWQDKAPTARGLKLQARFATPLFGAWFARRMARLRERNPVVWLQVYSWKSRTAKWGLCGAVLSAVIPEWNGESLWNWPAYILCFLALAGFATFLGVSSFLREKRSGALELILITPLSVNKLIFGRAIGMWRLFFPSVAVLYMSLVKNVGWFSPGGLSMDLGPFFMVSAIIAGVFLTLPIFAACFTLRVKSPLAAALLTLSVCIVAPFPVVLPFMFRISIYDVDTMPAIILFCLGMLLGYAAFGWLACRMLRHSLTRRIYSF